LDEVFPFLGRINCFSGSSTSKEEQLEKEKEHHALKHQDDSDVSHFDSLGDYRDLDHMDLEYNPDVAAAQYSINRQSEHSRTDHINSLQLLMALGSSTK
jgi:hypothetical protein